MSSIPENLHYTADHEWVQMVGDSTVRIGITDHAQDALGDIVFITLPAAGAAVSAGQPCGEVESTKSVSDIFAPVNGSVLSVNSDVEAQPEMINSDPYGQGWLCEIRVEGDMPVLLSASDYAALLGN